MPGLAAVLAYPGAPDLADTLERMLVPLTSPGCRTARVILPNWGVAFGHTGPGQTAALQPGLAAGGQVAALVEGEPLETSALAERLGLPASTSPADTVAALYAGQDAEALTQLRGHWALVIADSRLRQVVLANDAFGPRPLYRLHANDGAWLIASHPAALLAYSRATRAVDPAGLADFLAFGYPIGVKTIFQGVELLPAATLLMWKGGNLQARRYWQPAPRPARALDERDLEGVRTAFNESVGRMVKGGGSPLGLALSGGLDSRTILSALLVNGVSPQAITHSVQGATDAQFGAAVARAAGVPHSFLEVRGEELVAHVSSSVALLGGQAALIDAHPLSLLPDFKHLSSIWFTGLGGDVLQIAPNFMVRRPSQARNLPELSRWILKHHNRAINVDTDFPALFSPDWLAEWQGQPTRSVEEALAAIDPKIPLAEMNVIFYLEERVRKYLTKGDALVRTEVETRHPFLDRDVIERAWRLPLGARSDGTAHRFVITRNAPVLADVPITRSGVPLGCYPHTRRERWAAGMSHAPWGTIAYPLALWDRLENRLRHIRERGRQQPRRTFIPNYRYADWLRVPLRPMVEAVLLDPHTLSRPYFQRETIGRWVREHMAGQDHADKLMALMALELTLRTLIEN